MNVFEMATMVCTTVRAKDGEAVSDCISFLRNRYKMIWAGELWRDSLSGWTGTLASSSTDTVDAGNHWQENAEGYYLFPEITARVLALRTTGRSIDNVGADRMFSIDPDGFERVGSPLSYISLSPALMTNVTSQSLFLYASSGSDIGQPVTVQYVTLNGVRRREEVQLSTTYPTVGAALSEIPAIVERVIKQTTSGNIIISPLLSPFSINGEAEKTEIAPRIRIRFNPKPSSQMAFEALIKKQCSGLESDYDSPELRGVDQCLISFASGDMLRRARRYNQANELYAEAAALLKQLKDEATWQEETSVRITPVGEPGYMQIKDSQATL